MEILVELLLFLGATLFSVMALRALVCLRFCHRLPSAISSERLPFVSIIFAARDEEDRVAQTLHHLLAQRRIDFEIIPVDDRSQDRTGEILQRSSTENPRVRPKRIDLLPENWLGKCHALHLGAQSAVGEWLLFTDADCWLKPDVLARALTVAEKDGVDHITLTPGVAPEYLAAEAWHIAFLITVVDWIARVNQDKPQAHFGIGAFNLIRTTVYRRCGGHEALRLTVLEDIKLGKLVRKAGGRTRAFIGGDDVECHWGVTLSQMIKIMEKNYFAALNYNTPLALAIGILLPILWLASLLGPLSRSMLGVAAFCSLFLTIAPGLVLTRRLGWSPRSAWLVPFIFPVLYYAILNSTIVTLRHKGIRWRDTFYSLDLLRRHNVS
ncbi:MAG TPA: glycosyltransferase family 2 protein [Verrucomicrobiae bacterium]|nr:glycosyltransferase family 2 protein [Verrucomicrobiae bacterium]